MLGDETTKVQNMNLGKYMYMYVIERNNLRFSYRSVMLCVMFIDIVTVNPETIPKL